MTKRVAICGVPRAGKSTLSREMGDERSTDDIIGLGWSEASAEAARWFDDEGPMVVEGMTVPRALRKWLAANPEGRPVEEVRWLGTPREVLTSGQANMGKGARTVFEEILPELRRRGVVIHDDVADGTERR